MSKPTIEEYERAKEYISMLSVAMAESNECILDLVDKLTRGKNILDRYIQALKYNRNLIEVYENQEDI